MNIKSICLAIIMIAIFSSPAKASHFPAFCENTKVYSDSAAIVQIPASIGGCAGNIVGGVIGATGGALIGAPKEGAYISGLIFNFAGNAILGAPTKLLKSTFWDFPKKVFASKD